MEHNLKGFFYCCWNCNHWHRNTTSFRICRYDDNLFLCHVFRV